MRAPSAWLAVICGALLAGGAWAQPGAPVPSPLSPRRPSSAAGNCGVCHPHERVLFETSVHAREEARCISCHGGNDQVLEVGAAHSGRFVGRPARGDIPRLCATCHADEQKMRPYNLPVDQYALYQTSGHGKRLAAGDQRVAVCSDCHGAHDVLAPSDPGSRVFTLNIPRTCGRCHGDSLITRQDVYREYFSSVHARELLDRGNLRAPSCVSCHGAHGAAPPEFGDVDKVCGQCHTAERRYFASGPHRAALAQAGQAECVSCHGNHAIQMARPERLSQLCAQCHPPGSPAVTLGGRMWTQFRNASAELERAASLVAKAEAVPLNTEDYRARLEEAHTYLSEALPAAHSVQEEVVASFSNRARSVSAEVESEVYAKLGHLRTRRILLVVFWFYLLLTILILRRFRRAEQPGSHA